MASSSIILLPVAALLLLNFILFTDAESVGVCYGQKGEGLPSEQEVVNLYIKKGITRMRIYDPNPATLQALGGTNIELILGVLHESLKSLTDPNEATKWVQNNILNYPNVKFRYIAVGNEIDPNKESGQFANFVLPAMRNIQKAITDAGKHIKVSTATYTGLLSVSYPPRDGKFDDKVKGFIEPIIKFLVENKSPMLANIYPYIAYIGDKKNVPLPYALFKAPNDGQQYSNLFDAMLDAHYAAQSRLGGESLKIVVSESGWPSKGGDGATFENAETYYKNLIAHVKKATGTPARPGTSIETYLFAMFNENQKPGAETERHFGIFNRNKKPKYQLRF